MLLKIAFAIPGFPSCTYGLIINIQPISPVLNLLIILFICINLHTLKKPALIVVLCFVSLTSFTQNKLNFNYLGIENGLSQGFVTSIVQDSIGFMWFGTFDGLNKFDGYKFTAYYNDFKDTNTISNNYITAMATDNNRQVWIGTNNGLNYYDCKHDRFLHYNFKTPANNSNSIYALLIDKEGLVWFSYSNDSYLNCYDPVTKKIANYSIIGDTNLSDLYEGEFLKFEKVIYTTEIFESSEHEIWIGTNAGTIHIFSKEKSIFVKTFNLNEFGSITSFVEDFDHTIWASTINNGFCHINRNKGLISNMILTDLNLPHTGEIFEMIKNIDGTIWIGLQGNGLCIFNKSRNRIEQYQIGSNFTGPYNPRGIRSFFIERSGILWCGTNGYGIYSISAYSKKFNTLKKGNHDIKKLYKTYGIDYSAVVTSPENRINTLSFYSTRAIYADDENIYAGGYNGFDKVNRKTGIITNIIMDIIPYSICPDPVDPDILWIGVEGVGKSLNKYYKSTNKIIKVDDIECGFIFDLIFDKDKYLWIGHNNGLIRYHPQTHTVQKFSGNNGKNTDLRIGAVKSLLQDKDGYLWIGSDFGWIGKLDINNNKIEYITDQEYIQNILGNNSILNFFEDDDGSLWIGTGGSGLCHYDNNTGKLLQYSTHDGLPNNYIYAIIKDNAGYLWLSTNKGISRFDHKKIVAVNYTKSDGLQENEFNTGSYFKSKSGEIFFGGVDGITFFSPDAIKKNFYKPQIVLTSVRVNNDLLQFDKAIYFINDFTFSRNDVFTFEFAALSYYMVSNNRYECLLQGLNNKWILLGTENKVSFTGMKAGNYQLKIRASNNDGISGDIPLVITFRIPLPFYHEWWFIAISGIILALGIYLALYYWIRSIKNRSLNLEKLIVQRTKEISDKKEELNEQKLILEKTNHELKKLNDTKDRFFSIIGHDLRSPFNAILGFSELLEEEYERFSETEKKQFISNIRNASKNTYKLLHNLLEWASSQAGIKEYRPVIFDLSTLVNDNLIMIHSQLQQKKIAIISKVPKNTMTYADQEMINTVLRNLISNAVKFTYEGGAIIIESKDLLPGQPPQAEEQILVSVKDNGTGIQPEDIEKLFNIEKKTKKEGTAKEIGTGLGLIICKDFVERNRGKIWAENNDGNGSTFYFTVNKGY